MSFYFSFLSKLVEIQFYYLLSQSLTQIEQTHPFNKRMLNTIVLYNTLANNFTLVW